MSGSGVALRIVWTLVRGISIVSLDRRTTVHCKLGDGSYEVRLFAAAKGELKLDYVGSMLANSR